VEQPTILVQGTYTKVARLKAEKCSQRCSAAVLEVRNGIVDLDRREQWCAPIFGDVDDNSSSGWHGARGSWVNEEELCGESRRRVNDRGSSGWVETHLQRRHH
jgi:hypothetical protein